MNRKRRPRTGTTPKREDTPGALAQAVRAIQRRAAAHDGRLVSLGALVLFSTETGDAWILDRSEGLAARLARAGDPEPLELEETATHFLLGWTGHYEITGAAFTYRDRASGRVVTILGYPTTQLAPPRAG